MSNDIRSAKYSLLMAGQNSDLDSIKELLKSGLKIIWFGTEDEKKVLDRELAPYVGAQFLLPYINRKNIDIVIVDGISDDDTAKVLKELEEGDDKFNLEQYLIEHRSPDSNMIIEAGAGTGKTTVMIDRIMFLMHYCEDFSFSNVAMITFTNKATDNMRQKLINKLNLKYRLTGKTHYVDMIEELALINISTIHSFFRKVILEVGPILGYGTNLQLKSFAQEKRDILLELLDARYGSSGKRVEDVIGLNLNELIKLAYGYWERLENNGLSEDVAIMDWGTTSTQKSKLIQQSLQDLFLKVDEEYNKRKLIENAISMKDIIHELSRVIHHERIKEYITGRFKYLFCDEFQDSDNIQIQTIVMLNRIYKGNLFIVGDIKQSIYRFRGATDSAFTKVKELMEPDERDRLVPFTLSKNYRTSKDIMTEIDKVFSVWGSKKDQLLNYKEKDRLKATVDEAGDYMQLRIRSKDREKSTIDLIKEILARPDHNKVTCLARTNWELRQIKNWVEKTRTLVCDIREKGSFYTSPAVLDLCALVEAYHYHQVPMYIYNYIVSSYGPDNLILEELQACEGKRSQLLGYLYASLDSDKWKADQVELINRPVMAVLRRVINESDPVKNYAIRRKGYLLKLGYPLDKAIDQTVIDAKRYDANLKKLLQLLTEQFNGDFATLTDICGFLRLKIMTDSEEDQAEIDGVRADIEGLTVHSAKGLEFENVIIPFMNRAFNKNSRSEILVSKEHDRVGWVYRKEGQAQIKNDNYQKLLIDENREIAKEESRLLYVAMTRAEYGLYCLVERKNSTSGPPSCWADLLPEEKDYA